MARFRVEGLEPRACPTATDLGGGVVRLRDGFELQPFADWSGPCAVYDAGDRVWVGAGPGGGPRVGVFDPVTGERDRPDWFAGDPASRAGVVFVSPTPAPAATVSVGEPEWFTVFLDFESPENHGDYTRAVAAYFAGLPVRFTDSRPAAPPGTYGTAVVGAPTVWPGWSSGGYAPADDFGRPGDDWRARLVYVGAGGPAVAAHEIGHGFGLPHKRGTVLDELGPRGGFDPDQRAAIRARAVRPDSE